MQTKNWIQDNTIYSFVNWLFRLGPLEATAEIVEEEEEIETGLEDQKEEDGVESSLPLAEE